MQFKPITQATLGVLFVLFGWVNSWAAHLQADQLIYTKLDSTTASKIRDSFNTRLKVDSTNFRALDLLSTQELQVGNLNKAQSILKLVLEYAQSTNNTELVMRVLHKQGYAYALQQNIEQAYHSFAHAIQLDSTQGAFYQLNFNKLNIVELNTQLGDFNAAYSNLQSVQSYFEFTKDSFHLAYLELIKAQVLFEFKKDKSAYLSIKEANRLVPKQTDTTNFLSYTSCLLFAHHHLHTSAVDSAHYYLKTANSLNTTKAAEWLKPYEYYLNLLLLKQKQQNILFENQIIDYEKMLSTLPLSVWTSKMYSLILEYYSKRSATVRQLEIIQLKNNNDLELLSMIYKTKLIDKETFWRYSKQKATAQPEPIEPVIWPYVIVILAFLFFGFLSYFITITYRNKQTRKTRLISERLNRQTKSNYALTNVFSLKSRVIVLLSNEVSAMIQETKNALSLIKTASKDSFINDVVMPDLNHSLQVHQTQLLGVAAWVKNNLNARDFTLKSIDLNLAIAEVLQVLNYDLHKRGILLSNELPSKFTVQGDFEAYKIIVFNLLQFMVQQSVNGATIQITSSTLHGKTFIVIQDNGFGLSVMQLSNLFAVEQNGNKHEQIENLNLLIAKDLAQLMNASISASSKELNGLTLQIEINV